MKYSPSVLRAVLAGAALATLLAGCGGGGGDGGGSTPSPAATASIDISAQGKGGPTDFGPACTNCGAVDARTYAGSGVGVWEKRNTTGASLDVPVAISGLGGQDVTLVFTNESATDVPFPPINNAAQFGHDLLAQDLRSQVLPAKANDPHAGVAEFNRKGWSERLHGQQRESRLLQSMAARAPQAAGFAPGATRAFYHQDQSTRSATLQRQVTTSDGLQVNLWVEVGESGAGKVTAAMVDELATSFARAGGIYDMVKSVGGPLWGPHDVNGMIAGSVRSLDIAVLNFDRNQAAFGTVGYFWSLHQLARSVDSRSNEALSLYLDAETLYLGGDGGAKMVRMILAHEAMHMSNFYRRGVLMGQPYQYDTWLEELTAMMMEDAAATTIDASYSPLRDVRLRDYLRFGSYNCALRNWTPFGDPCESYAVGGSLGGFLLRQLGVAFLRNLLNERQASSELALDSAIRSVQPASGMGQQLRRFAASAIALLPASAPASFGFPARNEGGFDIPAVDASQLARWRTLPPASPSTLLAYGSFPVVRRAVQGTFAETVRVPAGTTLSVVVQ